MQLCDLSPSPSIEHLYLLYQTAQQVLVQVDIEDVVVLYLGDFMCVCVLMCAPVVVGQCDLLVNLYDAEQNEGRLTTIYLWLLSNHHLSFCC